MRHVFSLAIEAGRVTAGPYASEPGDRHGAFRVACPTGAVLAIIACPGDRWAAEGMAGEPWDHVSASLPGRTPSWAEMCWVKEQFFEAEECAVQYHPANSMYVNHHKYTLHIWRPCVTPLPAPPKECV